MGLASSSLTSAFPATQNGKQQHQWKYDVFLSFRGEDTRYSVISHLLAALSEKGVNDFIDYKLRRGDEITLALMQAIQESYIAVVVFSQNYASSSWCLDELVEIMECRETHGQIVIPVFYHVNPSDVRKQTGSFAKVIDPKGKINSNKVRKWKAALTRAANLSGWDSMVIRSEQELVDRIVKDVLEKLNQAFSLPTGLGRLVGINPPVEQIEEKLSMPIVGPNVGILGIWGIGGIGKTTVAEVIFSHISRQFEGCCFLKNVREEWQKGDRNKLFLELISKTLGDRHIKIDTSSVGPGKSLARRLSRKQILVILDDVDDPLQLEFLVGDPCWFGPGSRIIVTSRNRQAFEHMACYIHEVEALDVDAALQLFNQYAFKQNHPLPDYKPLSDLVVSYCQGNPLALKVLGSFLCGKNKIEWESAVNKLKRVPMREIQEMLKISYDGLDKEEQQIFLHIACFFEGEERDTVIQILNGCGFSSEIGIRVLIDKSLITTTTTWGGHVVLKVHDLLQEMGKEIVREESQEPGERSRLWDSEDIYHVFMNDTGTVKVEGIFLDMSKVRREIRLNSKAFEKMSNLKFLKFYIPKYLEGSEEEDYKVYLSNGLDCLSNELRYLHWYRFPLQYLPANFHPENLMWIELPCSNIKKLQSEAKPENFVKHFSSPSQFSMVTCLRLVDCQELTSLPNNIDMRCLDTLDLSGCFRLQMFPQISKNIKYLYLHETAIKEVPSSVQYLDRLVVLSLFRCKELQNLPTSICKLKCLEEVNLSCCSRLKTFPEILESMDNLESLDLSWTAIEKLPSSVENLKGLKKLTMMNCKEIAFLPQSLGNLKGLKKFWLSIYSVSTPKSEKHIAVKFINQDHGVSLLPSWLGMSCVTSLSVINCNLGRLTTNLGFLSSLETLDLGGNNFESIPKSIKQLTQLLILCIEDCPRLKSLPELPVSLWHIQANGCTSLQNIFSLNQLIFESKFLCHKFDFSNCFMLNEEERDPISRLSNRYFVEQMKGSRGGSKDDDYGPRVKICYPGCRIPEWFQYQSRGDSIRIPLPSNWLNDRFLGFALCLVVEDTDFEKIECHCHFGYDSDDNTSGSTFALECQSVVSWMAKSDTEHVVLFHGAKLYNMIAKNALRLTQCSYDVVFFYFQDVNTSPSQPQSSNNKVKKCGAIPLYAQDDESDSIAKWVGVEPVRPDVFDRLETMSNVFGRLETISFLGSLLFSVVQLILLYYSYGEGGSHFCLFLSFALSLIVYLN